MKDAPLRSDTMNVLDNENVSDSENVFDLVNVLDSVNVFDFVNVFENVFDSVSIGIERHPSIVVPLYALKLPNVSL